MTFKLPGLIDFTEGEKFLLELAELPKKQEKNIKKWLQITPKKDYLESVHEELNDVVVKLQRENMRLSDEVAEIKEHLKNSNPGSGASDNTSLFDQLAQEKPPHY